MSDDDLFDPPTLPRPQALPRPENGLSAWQATLGYINMMHSPDALIKLVAAPQDKSIQWSGRVSWGRQYEIVRDEASLANLLRMLWLEVERHHWIFSKPEDAVRRPAYYEDTQWIDIQTHEVLHRMLWTIGAAFPDDNWRLIVVYQVTEAMARRFQVRLIVPSSRSAVGGRGATLLDSLRDCFRNAIPVFTKES